MVRLERHCMPYPPPHDLVLVGKAEAIRQARREMYLRQVLIHFHERLDAQRADHDLDYVGVLRRVLDVVTQELARLETPS